MSRLARPDRQRLLDALNAVPGIEDPAVRTRLLRDLPPALPRSIPRAAAVGQDLFAIVTACEDWEPYPPTATPPLAVLIDNALPLVAGTGTTPILRALRALVAPDVDIAADMPMPIPVGHPPAALVELRRRLNAQLDDAQLDAFCLDHYSVVFDRFSAGMRRDAKITLLLDYCRRQANGLTMLQQTLSTIQGSE